MKNFLIYFFILLPLIITASNDPKPEKIYSITKVNMPMDYYVEQAGLWKAILEKDEKNAEAWQNYYMACRMINLKSGGKKPYQLNEIVDNIEKAIPDSYEFNYIKYADGNDRYGLFPYLEKAYNIDPERIDTYHSFISYHELKGNKSEMKKFCTKEYEAGVVCTSLLYWNYNVLMSVEENGILITQGDNDTYPLWTLQYAKGIRKDVKVWNIHLLRDKAYRDRLFKAANYPAFDESNYEGYQPLYNAMIEHIFKHAKDPVYLGQSISSTFRETHDANLYLVGMTLKYDLKGFDSMAVLKENYEQYFVKDYLMEDIFYDPCATVAAECNLHYIAPFVLMYKDYKESGNKIEASKLKKVITKIVTKSGRENMLDKLFKTKE